MSKISSGLVAFCYMNDQYEVALFSEPPTDPLYDDMFPVVRLSDAESMIAEKNAAIDRLEREASACDLLEEQKGTITALNMALGGEDSTSTENLIDSHDIDYNDEGLISLCRKLIAENIRLGDKLESTGCSPISEEVEDILRSENQRLKSQNQMLIERVDSWTRDAQTLNRQIEEYRQDSQTTADALGHIQQQFELTNQDRDDWIACHAKVFRELQETKALVGKQAERIKELESEILEQCRINGMGAEREAALLGKVERQSAALKLAREALFDMQDSYAAVHGWKDSFVIAATTAIAAIDALGEVK